MDILNLIGRRCLIKTGQYYNRGNVDEYKVLEVSPAGVWVKLQSIYGNKFWRPVSECSLVEVLQDFRTEKCPQ